jgi:nitrate reductase gamma subunit
MDFYELLRGPFAWVSLIVFFMGCLYRVLATLIKGRHKKILYPIKSLKGSFRSIVYGIIPFGSRYMRKHPVFTIVTVIFHICILILPLFLLSHIILWYESFKILWWSIPEHLADAMTLFVVLSCLFFLIRRIVVPETKSVSDIWDFLLLALIITPFITGFLATHQLGPYRPFLIMHILSGELLLITIPFSKLGHMLFFWLSRTYMGSEFGEVLNARDW